MGLRLARPFRSAFAFKKGASHHDEMPAFGQLGPAALGGADMKGDKTRNACSQVLHRAGPVQPGFEGLRPDLGVGFELNELDVGVLTVTIDPCRPDHGVANAEPAPILFGYEGAISEFSR